MAAFVFASVISLAGASATGGVVSLNLCTDELVLLVARPEQVRSVSYLSHAPEETLLWRRARRHRANDGSMLAAAALRPRVIVTMGTGGRDRERLARAVGARLLVLPFPQTIRDIETSVVRVGEATGNPARARGVIVAMRRVMAAAPPRAHDTIWVDGGGRTLGATGLGAEWLRLAGLKQRPIGGDRLRMETLLAHPPAVLVQSRYRAGQLSSATAWARHPLAARARPKQRLATDGRPWTCMGPTLVPEIVRLRTLVK